MGLATININVITDSIGTSVSVDDSVSGLIFSGPAPAGLALSTPKAIYSLAEAVALGIDEAYDTDNSVDTYQQLVDFYSWDTTGIELWIMILPQTTTLASACDKTNTGGVIKLLQAANNRVKKWGIHRIPDGAYVPTYDKGLDDDVYSAVLKADELCKSFLAQGTGCQAFIGARGFQGDVGNLHDFRTNSNELVEPFIGSLTEDGNPAIGYLLGRYASLPVQRKPSRVKNGTLSADAVYLSDGETIETYQAAMDSLHDKGYAFFKTIPLKAGYFFSSDPTAVAEGNDLAWITRGAVIIKAVEIATKTYIEELDDEVDVDEAGYMAPVSLKNFQGNVKTDLETGLAGNISEQPNAVKVVVNPVQNILATNKVIIESIKVRPKGYASDIEFSLGFDNPLNN